MDQIAIFAQKWLRREQARVTQGGLAQARALLPLVPPFNPRDWTAGWPSRQPRLRGSISAGTESLVRP